jgi:hypothetical protein
MKRRIVEIGGAIMLCLAAYLSLSIASTFLCVSLVEPHSGADATLSDPPPYWINFPSGRLNWPEFRTFCAGLCTAEELMQ